MLFQFTLTGQNGIYDPTQIGVSQFTELLYKGIQVAVSVIGVVILIYLLLAAIRYISAGGDPGKQGDAKKAIQASVIGFIIVVGALVLVNALLKQIQFNASILNETGVPTPPLTINTE